MMRVRSSTFRCIPYAFRFYVGDSFAIICFMIKQSTLILLAFSLFALPVMASAQTTPPISPDDYPPVYTIDTEDSNSDDDVIRPNDASGKMITIVGGETGRGVLNFLIRRQNDESLTDRERFIASFLQQLLLNRWYQIGQE